MEEGVRLICKTCKNVKRMYGWKVGLSVAFYHFSEVHGLSLMHFWHFAVSILQVFKNRILLKDELVVCLSRI